LPFLRKKNIIVIANIAGATVDDYEYMAKTVDGADVDMVELNISCPNVSEGGLAFGAKPSKVLEVTKKVRALTKKPLMVKLTPNVTDIAENAKAAEEGGADCISLINTISGMAVDADTKKAVLKNNFGGLSGAAIKPIALKMVHTVYKAVKIPVVGMGGIMSAKDVIEFMLCGATCVQVGTANLLNPLACFNIIKDLNDYLNSKNIQDISDLIGGLILN
jgi:dihydroorotate dehydrogenase (NAD+) catalytic subunit